MDTTKVAQLTTEMADLDKQIASLKQCKKLKQRELSALLYPPPKVEEAKEEAKP